MHAAIHFINIFIGERSVCTRQHSFEHICWRTFRVHRVTHFINKCIGDRFVFTGQHVL